MKELWFAIIVIAAYFLLAIGVKTHAFASDELYRIMGPLTYPMPLITCKQRFDEQASILEDASPKVTTVIDEPGVTIKEFEYALGDMYAVHRLTCNGYDNLFIFEKFIRPPLVRL